MESIMAKVRQYADSKREVRDYNHCWEEIQRLIDESKLQDVLNRK